MGTTLVPMPAGGPEEDSGFSAWPGDITPPHRVFRESQKSMKKYMGEAMGRPTKRKPKVKTHGTVENLAKEVGLKKKKRGPFGEPTPSKAAPMSAGIRASGNKGARVKESRGREAMESPIEKGPGHNPVARVQTMHGLPHFQLGGKLYAIDGGLVIEDQDHGYQAGECRASEVAPPGREEQVLALKKKFPKGSASPFKIAWAQQHGGGKRGSEARMGGLI